MRIMILSMWFSEKMGYAENYLPIALGKLGQDVHLVTTDLQVYANSPDYDRVYFKHLGPSQVETGIFQKKYFTLHRCNHLMNGELGIDDLEYKIQEIKPNVVYCFEILGPDYRKAIQLKSKYSYKLFSESRIHLSVFNKPVSFREKILFCRVYLRGWIDSSKVNLFYPIAPDVFHVITRYFGIPAKKCKISSLAVDTETYYKPMLNTIRIPFRKKLGFDDSDIVCLYTGRFTESKNPIILAQAINYLHDQGYTYFKAHFVGNGSDEYVGKIRSLKGCSVSEFVEAKQLVDYYLSFDIGVWPSQESTSQLDAAACGMPIILSDSVQDDFRVNGNGLKYIDLDFRDLADKIYSIKEKEERNKMGEIGKNKIAEYYSWDYLARKKIIDFNAY